ncbi:hypothetical protein L3X38_016890 [Prunus dulcis]|uniref:Uncharacterized protein n=1 Tax=Prunus dulcis TaxID=3755 RepID=A0AAD4W6B4_PRUDU|nr:hypothetical protein L3X38_016890 [Prunus dulcis]
MGIVTVGAQNGLANIEPNFVIRKVEVGGLHKVSMWDFVQVVVVATRVLEIRFGNWELRQVSGTSEVCLPSAGKKAWLPWC